MKHYDKLIFELSHEGRKGYSLPGAVSSEDTIPALDPSLCREAPLDLPEVSEQDVVRHYTNLSQMNFGVDTGFYPLGSCTMKYNPKINEEVSKYFAGGHPLTPDENMQGTLAVYKALEKALCAITGFSAFTFNPYAGAHGELTGLMVLRHYHEVRGDVARRKIIVPDSAHGTNPASAALAGLEVVQVKSLADGRIDVENLKTLLGPDIAGIMMTNPNTLGLFESSITEIVELIHGCGGLLYYDGANLNPLLGKVRPADMGFDIMHINLHKTFSTPHGGGGPGSGPVGVTEALAELLPEPYVVYSAEEGLYHRVRPAQSLGRVSGFGGNFGVMVKALAYIKALGAEGVKLCGPYATLSANYIKESLKDLYLLPIEGVCKHEFVFDGLRDKSTGVTTLDIAKRLLDYGYHAPTIYFPLLFHESIMIEPTETESKETIDEFIGVMRKIAEEAATEPSLVLNAPSCTPISRPDETKAATQPCLTYQS